MLSLSSFFEGMKDYVIIRMDSRFPEYTPGKDDIDILCSSYERTIAHLEKVLKKHYPKFSSRRRDLKHQVHWDVMRNSKFIIKFDLFTSIPHLYSAFDIPHGLSQVVISNGVVTEKPFRVPKLEHELMMRFLEYEDKYERRPDKVKHLRFIEENPDVKFLKFIRK